MESSIIIIVVLMSDKKTGEPHSATARLMKFV